MRGRPNLHTDYASDQAPLNTPAKRWWTAALVVVLAAAPIWLDGDLESRLTRVFVIAIGAIGLNLVTGYAGQVSLGHAFFLGVGAYTGAVFGASAGSITVGYELDMLIWLPLAGIVPAVIGFVIAPVATRLKGLYLAIVTLGLVFIGEHLFKELKFITGGVGVGRSMAKARMLGFDVSPGSPTFELGPLTLRGPIKFYLFSLAILIIMAVVSKNVTRSKVGRAFAAVRDRDIAAEVMGVPLTKYKVIAFTISSFYAGICGALLAIVNGGFLEPTFYNLILSITFLAVVLIGGASTLSGSLLGAAFVVLMPRLVQEFPRVIPFIEGGSTGGFLTVFQVEAILFGVLIIAFLILEPRGLFGLWFRVKNYWKAWPFSY